ncbi:MAG: DUF1353 domain-containing protein [Gammaproteobacteria bacterium]|nr:DUF1353 domain-containing protein [Gammaproteobacteria bacterium]
MSRFTDALVVSPLADGKTWVVLRPFGYDVGEEGSGDTVDVEIGFMTDFASIPRVFWWALPTWGKYGNAAVIHDWIYWRQDRPRQRADAVMFEAMGVLAVPAWQRYPIYWAVRMFGGIAWKRNQWDRASQFDRVARVTQFKSVKGSERPGLVQCTWREYRRRQRIGHSPQPQ